MLVKYLYIYLSICILLLLKCRGQKESPEVLRQQEQRRGTGAPELHGPGPQAQVLSSRHPSAPQGLFARAAPSRPATARSLRPSGSAGARGSAFPTSARLARGCCSRPRDWDSSSSQCPHH